MISWGLEVNDYGNALLDENKNFIKIKGAGVTEEMWSEMVEYAKSKSIKGGDYKKLNLPFENRLTGQPHAVRERMVKAVEDFIYNMLVNVLKAQDTAPLAIEAILKAGSYDLGPKATRIEEPSEWTQSKIVEKAKLINADKGSKGNYDD